MPTVNGKKYPYTPEGKRAAAKHAAKPTEKIKKKKSKEMRVGLGGY